MNEAKHNLERQGTLLQDLVLEIPEEERSILEHASLDEIMDEYIHLTAEQACDLSYLISRHFNPDLKNPMFPHSTPEEVCDPRFLMQGINEAMHAGFDGYESEHDKIVILRFIDDMVLYARNCKLMQE